MKHASKHDHTVEIRDWRDGASPELAADVRALQEERLTAHAHETGSLAELIHFHAALGDGERIQRLRAETAALDTVLCDLLLGGDAPVPGALLEQLDGSAEPALLYTAAKACLKHGQLDAVVRLVNLGLERGGRDVSVLNLLARHLSNRGAREHALATADASLSISECQDDLAALRGALREGKCPKFELHLEPVPRRHKVTVYLPVYNQERYIDRTMEALLCQSHPIAEILVVDDGSTDRSTEFVERYPVVILRHAENRGLAIARNTALRHARTPLLASFDTDVMPSPGYLRYVLMELENTGPEVAGAGGRLVELNALHPPDRWRAVHMEQNPGDLRIHTPDFLHGNNSVFRREALLQVGGYDTNLRTNAEDTDVCRRLREDGRTLTYTPNALTFHARTDTLHSVLRAKWNWAFWVRKGNGEYDDAASVVNAASGLLNLSAALLNRDMGRNLLGLLHIDFLMFFYDTLQDLNWAVAQGMLAAAEGRFVQESLLNGLEYLDDRHGGRLVARVRTLVAPLLQQAEPTPFATEPLRAVLARMAQMYETIDEPVYQELDRQLAEAAQAAGPAT